MIMTYDEAVKKLTPAGQQHLLKYYNEITKEQQERLLDQIDKLDLSLLKLIDSGVKGVPKGKLEPLGAITLAEVAADRDRYEKIGLEAIRACKIGAVLLAGGQGTRFGLDKPKGMLDVGVSKPLYLFGQLIHNLMTVGRIMFSFLFRIWLHRLVMKAKFIWRTRIVCQLPRMETAGGLLLL